MTLSSRSCSAMHPLVSDDGFTLIPGILTPPECSRLVDALGSMPVAGRRGVLALPAVRTLAESMFLRSLLEPHMSGVPFPVRGIFFDKSPESNWLVAWHQDLTIVVREKTELPDYGPWSVKEGLIHVQPPVAVLEQMLTLRLHLDDADDSNGALRVLPGTHRLGRLDGVEIQRLIREAKPVTCEAKTGDALLMKPLILHASSRATMPKHRRVLHLEYACAPLPNRMRWAEG